MPQNPGSHEQKKEDVKEPGKQDIVESGARLALLLLLLVWCFNLLRPFLDLVIWGMILAVSLYPLHGKLCRLGLRAGLAATLIALIGLMLVLAPGGYVGIAGAEMTASVVEILQTGDIDLPRPHPSVKTWPIVGEQLYQQWSLATKDIELFIESHAESIINFALGVAGVAGSAAIGLFKFCGSIIVAAVFLTNAQACIRGMILLAGRVLGQDGTAIIQLCGATIQSVTTGVLGVAVIQTALISLGFFAVGLALAPALSLLVLVMTIAQLPAGLVVIPVVIHVFNTEPTWIAVLFAIWSILAGVSENFLKPLLMGRGVDVPMLVILLGSLGGMIMSGFVGLFIGAVVLAVGYRLLAAWVVNIPQK